ncbi:MAG: OB-fold domain-containing protein [Gemmatimonadota bacterium]
MTRRVIEPGIIALPDAEHDAPRLRASRCAGCGAVFHPPRPVCLVCHGRVLEGVQLSGRGTLYACTLVQMPLRPSRREHPSYWVGQVDLDAGPRVQGLLAPDLDAPRIGMRLDLGLETLRVDDGGREVVVHHFRAEDPNT